MAGFYIPSQKRPADMPRLHFPRNKRGNIKCLPCVCGTDRRPAEDDNTVRCPDCGRYTSTPYREIRWNGANPRYDWNRRMAVLLWRFRRDLFWQVRNQTRVNKRTKS